MLSKVQPLSLVSSFRPHDHNRWQCSVARQPGSRRHSASAICFQALLHALQDGVCHLQELPPRVPHLLALHLLVDEPRPQIFRFGFEISPQHGPRHPAHPFSSSGALACCAPASLLVSAPTDARSPRPTQQTNKQRNFTPYPRDKEWKQLSLIQRGACTSALVRARSSVRSIRGGGTRHGLLLEMMTSSGGRARRCGAASSWQQGRGEERLRPVSKHEIKLSLRETEAKPARLLRTEAPTRPEEHRHHDRHRRDHRHPGRGARNRIRRHPPHRAQPPRAAHDRSAHRHEAM